MSNFVVAMMLGVSIFLAAIALLALLWGLKRGYFDDRNKFLDIVHSDSEDDLNDAVIMEKRKEEAKRKDKEKNYRPPD
ncbi:MAG: cbb3-type cytochrome oxidase assembly protein CcoS [Campylobacteraceae bacterium]